ncbi:ATP-grasp domain-containing protein [Jatrophihabitans sp.]|uniref:ATP-grasp domain-containing protein n=1 Tax=Jatrophihabitans sp. TaxID=1932789 RepID=UPI002C144908|nr:ATP-grasp domain-containing protein [Jatrophihabitans sp.]
MSLVILGASANMIRTAHQLDTDLVIVQLPGTASAAFVRPEKDELYTVDYLDAGQLAAFAELLRGRGDIDGVVSTTERGLEPAARLVEQLGVAGNALSTVLASRDKRLMRRLLATQAPDLTVPFAPATDDRAVADLLGSHPRAIFKPAHGTGSAGVRMVSNIDDVLRIPAADREDGLVEAFLTGVEVTVETLSTAGQHTVLGVVEKWITENFVEVGHVMPPPSLSPAQCERAGLAVGRLLDILGLTDGVACTEVMVDGDDVRIIETHNRLGGDGVADLIHAITGLDWRLTALGWPVGELPERQPPRAAAAAMVFFVADQGVVSSVLRQPPELDGVTFELWAPSAAVGDPVGPLRSSDDRLGAARLIGPDPQVCAKALEHVLSLNVVRTAGG